MNPKKKNSVIRQQFYNMTDSLWGLKSVAKELQDEELQKMVEKLMQVKNELLNHINSNYIWN